MRGRIRGRVLLLLCVMYAISYLDRTNISTAAPSIQDSLHLSDGQLGLALSAFSLPYALLQVFGGSIGGRLGPRRSLAVIGILWAIATAATGFSVGLASLIGARLLLGLSEAAAFPTATDAMSRWVPADRRGFAQGVVHSASRLGNAAAPVLVAALIAATGWRASFWLVGLLSVLWAVLWYVSFRDLPGRHPKVGAVELAEVHGDVPATTARPKTPWRQLIRTLAPVAFVDFGYGWTLWVFLTWLPSYFSHGLGLKLSAFAAFTSLVLLAGVVGDTAGGMLSDRLLRRGATLRSARRTSLLVGLLGSLVCLLPMLVTHDLVTATVSLALSFFFLELTNATLWAIPMDVAPAFAGAASGMMNTGFGVAGVLSPTVFGYVEQITGSWQVPFGASVLLLGAAAVVAARMNPRPITTTA